MSLYVYLEEVPTKTFTIFLFGKNSFTWWFSVIVLSTHDSMSYRVPIHDSHLQTSNGVSYGRFTRHALWPVASELSKWPHKKRSAIIKNKIFKTNSTIFCKTSIEKNCNYIVFYFIINFNLIYSTKKKLFCALNIYIY